MSSLFVLDTDTISFALRGQGKVSQELLRHAPSVLCISAISVAELRFGAAKRGSRKLNGLLDHFLSDIRVAPFDEEVATKFGSVAAKLLAAGTPIGTLDTMIAAQALCLGAVLVTNNTKHFSRVENLPLENWF